MGQLKQNVILLGGVIAGFHFCFSEKLNLDAFSFIFQSSFYGILVELCQVSSFGYISRHNRHFS